jgi:hypothetical protein
MWERDYFLEVKRGGHIAEDIYFSLLRLPYFQHALEQLFSHLIVCPTQLRVLAKTQSISYVRLHSHSVFLKTKASLPNSNIEFSVIILCGRSRTSIFILFRKKTFLYYSLFIMPQLSSLDAGFSPPNIGIYRGCFDEGFSRQPWSRSTVSHSRRKSPKLNLQLVLRLYNVYAWRYASTPIWREVRG